MRFGARQQGGREFADRWALQALVRAGFRTSLQRMSGVGVSSRSTPVARLVSLTGGGTRLLTREGPGEAQEGAPKRHYRTTGNLLLALRSDGHEQLAAAGPGTP